MPRRHERPAAAGTLPRGEDPSAAFERSIPSVVPHEPLLPAEEVCGADRGAGFDVRGDSVAGHGVHGEADSGVGVYGVTTTSREGVGGVSADGGYGVAGTIESGGGVGVFGSPEGIGICRESTNGLAGRLPGNVNVNGDIAVGGDSTIGGRTAIAGNTAIAGRISIGGDTTIGGHADVAGDLSVGTPSAATNLIVRGDTSIDASSTIGAVGDRGRSPLRRERCCRCHSPLDALTQLAQHHGVAAVTHSVPADHREHEITTARAFLRVDSALEQLTPIAVDSIGDAAWTRSR
jgi:hypothetical protein